jgi:polyisoprenoid-binding protein YceI
MKKIASKFLLMLIMALPIAIYAQTAYEVKSHTIVIEGTSNLHDWTADVEKVAGTFNMKVENGKIVGIDKLSINVDAESLKGSKGSIMNGKIYEALNSKKHPQISFSLNKVNSIEEQSGNIKISTSGMLTVSGVSKPISLIATGRVMPTGEIEFIGTTSLKMTDYSVKPPTAMFGALTTGDEIKLNYKVVVKPQLLTEKK